MAGNSDLFAALEQFQKGVDRYALSQTIRNAQQAVSDIKSQATSDSEQRSQLQQIANQMVSNLGAQGVDPARVKQLAQSVDPLSGMYGEIAVAGAKAGSKGLDKETRDRFVPGFGFAANKSLADKVMASNATADASLGDIQKLQTINDSFLGGSVSTTSRAEAEVLSKGLQGKLKELLVGGGAITDSDREVLESVIANPTTFFSLSKSNKAKYKTLINSIQRAKAANVKSGGFVSDPTSLPDQGQNAAPSAESVFSNPRYFKR